MMNISQILQNAFSSHMPVWYILALSFIAGVLISFTPCVYPMIPITAGILQSQAERSFFYNFLSALMYVMGLSVVYAGLGYLSATTSMMFGMWLSKPWFVAIVLCFFIYMAFSMFGFYELRMPAFFSRHMPFHSGTSLISCFVFGLVSGTVASPCLTPALAVLLGIIAKHANPVLGFFALLSFSLGMGTLLLIIGTFSATVSLLPRAGEWMNLIRSALGFLMLGACVYFAQSFTTPLTAQCLYLALAIIAFLVYIRKIRVSRVSLVLSITALLLITLMASNIVKMLM